VFVKAFSGRLDHGFDSVFPLLDHFSSLMEKESNVHVELGHDDRYAVKGE
jgi:hypothetical protein